MNDYIVKFDGDNRFLSNFYPSKITYEGKVYDTTEHAYQASKTLDDNERESVRSAQGANAAKKAGRKVTLRKDWNDIKDDIMLSILRLKFSDADLKDRLLKTQDKVLIEGNYWHDNWFGVCYCEKCKGIGKNRLGQLLMKVRSELNASPATTPMSDLLTTDTDDTFDIPEI